VIKVRRLQTFVWCKFWLQVRNQCRLYGIRTTIEQTSLAFLALGVVHNRATSFSRMVQNGMHMN